MQASLLLMRGLEVDASPEQALRYYQAAGKLEPRNLWAAQHAGGILCWLKRYDEAMPYYRLVTQKLGDKAPYEMRTRVQMYGAQHGHPHPARQF